MTEQTSTAALAARLRAVRAYPDGPRDSTTRLNRNAGRREGYVAGWAAALSVSAEQVEAALVDALDDHLAENASMNAAVSDVLEALAVLGITVTDDLR